MQNLIIELENTVTELHTRLQASFVEKQADNIKQVKQNAQQNLNLSLLQSSSGLNTTMEMLD